MLNVAVTEVRLQRTRIVAFIGKSIAAEWMVAHAVQCEPVSAAKFPANREKNREFLHFIPFCGKRALVRSMMSRLFDRIPYSPEQGIS